jgi:hypothetical protein
MTAARIIITTKTTVAHSQVVVVGKLGSEVVEPPRMVNMGSVFEQTIE